MVRPHFGIVIAVIGACSSSAKRIHVLTLDPLRGRYLHRDSLAAAIRSGLGM